MTSPPRVSLILPVHNAAAFLPAALDSLLSQTFRDFELIAIDDASTDTSPAILAACADPRLRVLRNPENLGVAGTLNRGLAVATAPYIARMDADDIALPERLQRQVAFLDRHPEVVLLGTAFYPFRTGEPPRAAVFPESSDRLIRWYSCWYNRFAHPTVMFRRAALSGLEIPHYDPRLKVAEDYDLWTRLLAVGQGANLTTPLLLYRMHPASASVRQAGHLAAEHLAVASRFAATILGEALPPAQQQAIIGLFLDGAGTDAAFPLRRYLDLAARYDARYDSGSCHRQIVGEILLRLARRGALRHLLHPDALWTLAAKGSRRVRFHPRRLSVLR